MFAIEHVVKDVSLSQSGCEVREDGLVMIDSEASVNVCHKWFGKSTLQKSDGSVLLQGADGRTLEDYGKRQIWLKIRNNLKRYDFHVVGDEADPEHQLLVRTQNRNTPRKRTIPEVWRQTRTFDQEKRCVLRQYKQEILKIDEDEQETHKSHEYEHEIQKSPEESCVRAGDSQN